MVSEVARIFTGDTHDKKLFSYTIRYPLSTTKVHLKIIVKIIDFNSLLHDGIAPYSLPARSKVFPKVV